MTTMSDTGSPSYAGPPQFSAPRALRRSRVDRVISGVSGGLGEYFGVDPVIFRVLFAVLSFFGGIGLLAYGLAWVLIPEPEVNRSLLDKALDQLRIRKVPPWLVIIGGVLVVWLGWFAWWAPHTLPALVLLGLVALVLARRLRNRPLPPVGWTPPAAGAAPSADLAPTADLPATADLAPTADLAAAPAPATPTEARSEVAPSDGPDPAEAGTPAPGTSASGLLWPAGTSADAAAGSDPATEDTVALSDESRSGTYPTTPLEPAWTAAGQPAAGFAWQPPPAGRQQASAPLIPPLNDTRRTMQAWLAEAGEAHRIRVQRRRPIKVAVLLALLVGWGLVALFDALFRVPFPVYLWVGLGVLGLGLLVGIAARRAVYSLLIPIVFLAAVAVAFGGTRASLSDGSGRMGWLPAAQSQLGSYRQFAGQSTLDLTQLAPLGSPASVTITQAAGEVVLKLPATLNATVIADVHMGDIQNGRSTAAGQFQAGLNVHLQLNPPATATGEPLTVHVSLTTGHVQVDRVS